MTSVLCSKIQKQLYLLFLKWTIYKESRALFESRECDNLVLYSNVVYFKDEFYVNIPT